jgi:hypothetical protein
MLKRCVLFAAIVVFALSAAGAAAVTPDDGARSIVRVDISHKGDLEKVLSLDGLDIAGSVKGQWVDLVIHPSRVDTLSLRGLNVTVRVADTGKALEEQMGDSRISFGNYDTYAESLAAFQALAAAYPSLTKMETIGYSHEGYALFALKVSDDADTEDPTEPEVLITGAHHAREPIGPTLCREHATRLLENYGTDPDDTRRVDETEIWYVPIVNPDGYRYNETYSSGMWRKNRRNNGDGSYGVDLNRNYGYQWGYDNSGSSPYTGDETYRGPSAFSEPEIQAVRDFCNDHEFAVALNYHSYGNYLLYPWGYADIYTPDNALFVSMTDVMDDWNGYSTGTAWELLYNTNGDANDWMYGEQSTKPKTLAITPEVGESFWQDDQIPNHLNENLPMMNYLVDLAGSAVIAYAAHEILDADGRLDAGETAQMTVTLNNQGFAEVDNVQVTLSESDSYVTLLDASGSYGTIGSFGSATNTGDTFTVQAAPGTPVGHPAAITMQITGDGGFSATGSFTLSVGLPPVLLVDDDAGDTYQGYFETAITNAGYSYDLWTVAGQGSPAAGDLLQYSAVVWLTGDDWSSTLTSADQSALAAFLDSGRSLFITGQDIGYDIGSSSFYGTYLKASYVTDDFNDTSLVAVAGDPIADGLNLAISGGDGANNQTYPSQINASGGSTACWTYDGSATAAVRYEGDYKLLYLAFGYEAVNNQADRDVVMTRVLDWFIGTTPPTDTVGAGLNCLPDSGTLPFVSQFSAALTNLTVENRRAAARIDVTIANGASYTSWRAGWTNLSPAEVFSTVWNQPLPALGSLVGANVFTLAAEDVTPAPYNQPPFAASGDTDTGSCTITAAAP